MKRIREVLRLNNDFQHSQREIAAATSLSKGSVSSYLRRADLAGVTWPDAQQLSDSELERRLFPAEPVTRGIEWMPVDCEWVYREMHRKGVTLQLLWVEYRDAARHDPKKRRPYQYSQFCTQYRRFRKKVDVSMRQEHRAGEKVFIDYSGVKLHIWHCPEKVDTLVKLLSQQSWFRSNASRIRLG